VNNSTAAQNLGESLIDKIKTHMISGHERVVVVSAAPGSGKSTALMNLALDLLALPGVQRVAVAAQTNNQATDLSLKLSNLAVKRERDPKMVYRFASSRQNPHPDFLGHWVTSAKDISDVKDCVVIATAAKWGQAVVPSSKGQTPFTADFVLVDEAYQMPWSTFMQVSCLGPKFILIGDEGQIDPVVPVDATRWNSANFPPHWPTPKIVSRNQRVLGDRYLKGELEFCWRLPFESISYIQPFYSQKNLTVKPVASPGGRKILFDETKMDLEKPVDLALSMMATGEPVLVALQDSETGNPIEDDNELIRTVRETLKRLFECKAEYFREDGKPGTNSGVLQVSDVAICSTKRAMNAKIEDAIQDVIRELPIPRGSEEIPNHGLKVDTPERLQGLEFKVVLVVHPLSGVENPGVFDLDTGRLCVMTSRHEQGLIIFSRNHIFSTLETKIPVALQAPNLDDTAGIGHNLNRVFLNMLKTNSRVVPMST
jgi:hypothetical protein